MKSKLFRCSVLALVVFVLLNVSSAQTAPAGTNVGGPIISDTTWTVSGSPYFVIATVQVLTGVKLTIQPGVVVKFNAGKLLQVDGTLIARGTATTPITFTSNLPNPQRGDWGNIEFTDTSVDAIFDGGGNYVGGSVLQYCTVEYGGGGSTVNGAIETNTASPFIDHCIVRNNNGKGIRGVGTATVPIVISNNTVTGNLLPSSFASNGGGIYASYGTVVGNTVSGNSTQGIDYSGGGGGGIFASSSTVTGNIVTSNSVRWSNGGGIYASNSTVSGNTVSWNQTFGGYNQGGDGGGIYAYNSNVMSNIVNGNWTGGGWGNGGGISANNSMVTGNTVTGNSAQAQYTNGGGGISAYGSILAGNMVSGNSAYHGQGGGINAMISSMQGNTIIANKVSVTGQGSGVYLINTFYGYSDFLYNTVVGNTTISLTTAKIGGVAIDDGYGTSQFHANNLYGNSPYDAVVISSADISGTNNYWGTVNTVDILMQVYDWYDDTSRGRLLYIPYLQDPDPNAPVPPPLNLRVAYSGDSITLSWDPIPSFTTGYGYKIYYDTDTFDPPYNGTGLAQGNSPIDVGNATTYTLSGLGSATYFLAATGYDTLGHESWYSNAVAASIAADLQVFKYDSSDPVKAGSALTYTIYVWNAGPSIATGIRLTDTLPANVTFRSATSGQGNCNGTSVITCDIGLLNSNSFAVVTIVVTPTKLGLISNTATATGNAPDLYSLNNTDTEDTVVKAYVYLPIILK